MGKVEAPKKHVEQTEEDTYALSKRSMKKEIESLKKSIEDLTSIVQRMGIDLAQVMDRMGLWARIKNQQWWK